MLENTAGTPPLGAPRQLPAFGAQLVGDQPGEAIERSPLPGTRRTAALDGHAQRSHRFQQGIGHEAIRGV